MQPRRQVCLSSMSPGPTSREAEHVSPVGTRKHTYLTHMHIYMDGHTDNRDRHSPHSQRHKQHQQLHLIPTLAEQDGDSLVENTYMHMFKVDPSSSWAETQSAQ